MCARRSRWCAPPFRDEVKEPRDPRFDPADQPIFSVAVTLRTTAQLRELTTIADQVVKKRLETVRGVGSVTLVGGVKREIKIYVKPTDMEALGVGVDQVINAVRNENQELADRRVRSANDERVVQVERPHEGPDDFGRHHRRPARRPRRSRCAQVANVVDGQQEQDSLALLQRPAHAALDVVKAQGENTIDVARRPARSAIDRAAERLPPGVKLDVDPRRLAPDPVGGQRARTLIEGAALTIADRVPVPQFLALDRHHRPDAADRADRHLPVHVRIRLHDQHASR